MWRTLCECLFLVCAVPHTHTQTHKCSFVHIIALCWATALGYHILTARGYMFCGARTFNTVPYTHFFLSLGYGAMCRAGVFVLYTNTYIKYIPHDAKQHSARKFYSRTNPNHAMQAIRAAKVVVVDSWRTLKCEWCSHCCCRLLNIANV